VTTRSSILNHAANYLGGNEERQSPLRLDELQGYNGPGAKDKFTLNTHGGAFGTTVSVDLVCALNKRVDESVAARYTASLVLPVLSGNITAIVIRDAEPGSHVLLVA
jgi:hypothetical protein